MGISRRTLLLSGSGVVLLGAAGAAGQFLLPKDPEAPAEETVTDEKPQREFPDMANVWGFGSSTMALLGPYLADKFAGATFHPQGSGGERTQHIFARLGSTPARLALSGGRIPATGSVTATAWNMQPSASLKPYTGTLGGVPGVLSSTAKALTFTRSGTGHAVRVPDGTRFIPSTMNEVRNSVTLINAGKNNLRDSGDAIGLVTQLTFAAHDWMAPRIKCCVPMTHFVNSDQGPGSVQFTNVQGVNRNILDRYGELAFDLNAYVLSSQIWDDTNIAPTSRDLQKQAAGMKPDSLSRDVAHLGPAANAAVASRIQDHFVSLGYYPAAKAMPGTKV